MVTARTLVTASTVGAAALAVHTAVNLRLLRTPRSTGAPIDESVAILIPARNEAAHIEQTVRSATHQNDVARLRIVVLDDGSEDNTATIVRALAEIDERIELISAPDEPPPAGWLGKPWACFRLAQAVSGTDVLCFVDADVDLEPDAVAASVALLREQDFALVAPYPHQVADSWLERLVQPLVTWSWAATMPVRWAETSARPSLSAANGQLLVLDASAYAAIDGHGSVRGDVLEDIGLMRALKRAGFRTATVDGSVLAHCRMYEGAEAVVDGYSKSLWSAFNGPVGTLAVCGALTALYVVPAIALVTSRDRRTRAIAAAGYAAGVTSRALVARRTGERVLPDTLAHPVSVATFAALNAISWWRHARGANSWKGRPVTVGSDA